MTHKFKSLGLAFAAAVIAMSLVAGMAQATQFHVNNPEKAIIRGEQPAAEKHKLQLTSAAAGPSTQCNQVSFEGTVQGPPPQITVQELTLTPRFTGCTFLGLASTITMNGCKLTFTQSVPTANKTMLVDIAGCTAAAPRIEKHVPGCTVTIPQQTGLSHATFAQNATHVDMTFTLSGITYETHGAACAHQPETVLKHDASWTGKVTLKGFQDDSQTVHTHNGHQYTAGVAGAAVSILVT